jgi:hypothetical protein
MLLGAILVARCTWKNIAIYIYIYIYTTAGELDV